MTDDAALADRVSKQEQVIRRLRREVAAGKQAVEAAQQTADCYRAVFDSLGAAFCVVQIVFDEGGEPIDYRFKDVNIAFEKQTGLTDALGKTMRELMPDQDPAWLSVYAEVAVTGEPRRVEDINGSASSYDVFAFRAGPAQQSNVAILFSDLSGRERADAAEREAASLRDRFLATLAHELRNPLAPLQSGLDVLRLARSEPAANGGAERQMLEIMSRQLDHLTHLMDELLDMSEITRGVVSIDRRPMDLTDAIRRGAQAAASFTHAGGRHFTLDLPREPLLVDGDEERLAQVVGNLLENAGKFTAEGGHISLTARRQGRVARISVLDDGLGIEREMLEEIFGMFRQTSTDRHGLGLGLTLVRDLVMLHGGTVEARSDGRGRGSEFIVEIPLSRSARPASPAMAPRLLPSLERQRMLVVDDNHDAADSLAVLLRTMGGEVRTAYDGRSALSLLDELQPHIVFLDIGMPGMDGYEVARLMRRRRSGATAVLVAVTGWGQPADRQRASDAGFDDHLLKPATYSDLQSIVEAGRVLR